MTKKINTEIAPGSSRRGPHPCAPSALLALALAFVGPSHAAEAPACAKEVGYNDNTFSTRFDSSDVDIGDSGKSGFSWYLNHLFGTHTPPSLVVLNPDHSVTLTGSPAVLNGQIVSATAAKNAGNFIGTAFGGGAYIEAEFNFNPDDVARADTKGWPSFWSLALEGTFLPNADAWPGQPPGYRHNVEVDFFEYLLAKGTEPREAYGGGMHDWYGIPKVTCPKGLCGEHIPYGQAKRMADPGHDFTQYHRHGYLWVPATETTQGYARFYLDGKQVGPEKRWTKFTNQPPPPTKQPWAFGRLDQQHLILIIGSGTNQPMTVRSVNVWQKSSKNNLHN